MHDLRHLFIEDIHDMYSAEQQILKALPEMIKAASSEQLKQGFQQHLMQTQMHVTRLERAMSQMGEKVSAKFCKGMEGILKEGEEVLKNKQRSDAAVLDAALIAAAQKVEHYEIASYGTICTYAKLLGEQDVLKALGQTLDEEKDTDQRLTRMAESYINAEAVQTSPSRGNSKHA